MKSLRKNFYYDVGGTNIMPIPLRLGTLLVPVNVRKPIGRNDGSYGYIDLSSIEDAAAGNGTVIKLKCGLAINSLETLRTIRYRIKSGILFEEKFAERMMWDKCLKDGLGDIGCEYDMAATRRDITLLAYEIMKLRKKEE